MPEVIHARDGLARLAARLGELGARRVLVLAPPSRRHVDRVAAALAAFHVEVFDGARVHVPAEVLERAAAALAASRADTLVSVGGGSTVGLGKALRLAHEVRFAAVPTTYAGSEMTSMYGVTTANDKRTGRDERVRPDLVVYDATLGATLPIGVTVQSLLNALAHVIGALSTGTAARAEALAAGAAVLAAVEDLLLAPASLEARERASRAAGDAARVFDGGRAGVQHALAHLLGGGLGIDHAPLHSVLLPQTIAHLRERDPALVAEIETALGYPDLEAQLVDLLQRAGAPTSLAELGVDAAAARALVAARGELPAAAVDDAQIGLRPTPRRIDLGPPPLALLAGPPPERARRVVLALHGRGAEAGGIVRRYREIAGHDPEVAVIGLRAEGGNRWYGIKYSEPGAGRDPEVERALARVGAAVERLPPDIVLAGFSQGACLALEWAARHGAGLNAVLAPCGARLGRPGEWGPAERLDGLRVLLGAGAADPYVDGRHVEATGAWFRDAGAAVEVIGHPGDRHDIMARQRIRAREILRGGAPSRGPAGLGNTLESEALPGALPARQNSPRRAPLGLYAEQVNGTGFTARRGENARTWLYRVRPSSQRRAYAPLAHPRLGGFEGRPAEVNLFGLAPLPPPPEPRDFVDGLHTVGGAGSAALRRGYAVHLYSADRDMERRAFYDADGDLLLVPELGALTVLTELGALEVAPGQIAILPRGIAFSVALHGPHARGYVGEAFGRRFQLPERGPIGANGLADARHFRAPSPWYEDKLAPDFRVVAKLDGRLHEASQDHSPFDVVAWHGNHVPFVYDLDDFSPVANVRFDHGDPSVFTVLTAPLDEPGASALDLIVFPTRWDATEGTFRPPFFHRNPVTEVNGIVREPRASGPFVPGCCFVTPGFTPHGTSARTVDRVLAASDADADRPLRLGGEALWFQLESALPMALTPWAEAQRLPGWPSTWGGHRARFAP
jgi:homogentisate 1,2-dioxygenase